MATGAASASSAASWPATPGRASWSRPRWAAGRAETRALHAGKLPRLDDRSRVNLGTDRLDLVQLHSPPTAVFARTPLCRRARHAGSRGLHRGIRGERGTSDQALTAIARPAWPGADHPERVPAQAAWTVLLRRPRRVSASRAVPLASGLLSAGTPGHHVRCRRPPQLQPHGEAFDVGETFSGVGLERAPTRRPSSRPITGGLPGGHPAQWALRGSSSSPA